MKCKRCGGILDENLHCLMCAREFKVIQQISDRRRREILQQSGRVEVEIQRLKVLKP